MNKFTADNLAFLEQEYSNIYHALRKNTYNKKKIEIVYSKNGQTNLCVIANETRHMLYSRYNPEQEVRKWLDLLDEKIKNSKHVLFCGFGLGYHIEAFLNEYPNKLVYIYEPDTDVFLAALESRDLRPVLKNKQVAIFAVGIDPLIQMNFLESVYQVITDSFAYTVVPVTYRRFLGREIDNFEEQIKNEALKFRANVHTSIRFQKEWSENFIYNIAHNINSYPFSKMKDACEGIPAIVVGSGPSLNSEIDMLRNLKGRALIISAGSAVQALLKHGIEPDLMVSIDPNVANQRVFSGLNIKEIPFLYCPTIKHTILDQELPYLTHIFFSTDVITRFLMDIPEDEPFFLSTSTVTGTAIQAAVFMNCSEIVLVGQDFSYPNDQYYAAGVQHVEISEMKRQIEKSEEFVESVRGGLNRTNKSMLVLKASVETVLDMFEYSEYYNASQIGAKIEYTRPKTLQQLYEEQQATHMGENWFRVLMEQRLTKYSPERVKRVEERVLETFSELQTITSDLNEIEECLNRARDLSPEDPIQIETWLIDFSERWKKVAESDVFRVFYWFLLQVELNILDRNAREIESEPNLYEKVNKIRPITKFFIDGANQVNPILKDSLETLIDKMSWKEVKCDD